MKKGFFKAVFILIVIFSLSLNIVLLLDKQKNNENEISLDEITDNEINNSKIEYTKEDITKLFKDYQTVSNLITSSNIVKWEVVKVEKIGHYNDNTSKTVYIIEEKYRCMDGSDCVKAEKITNTDEEYNNYASFIVSIIPIEKDNAIIEILDTTIYDNPSFVKTKTIELK